MDRKKVVGKIEEEIRLGKYWDEFRRTVDLQLLRDALELLKEDCHNCKLECLLQKYDELKEKYDALLKEKEARTGHWVSVNDGDAVVIDSDGFPERACYCSECKKYLIASDEYAVYGRYCPFCGVKMEGRERDA